MILEKVGKVESELSVSPKKRAFSPLCAVPLVLASTEAIILVTCHGLSSYIWPVTAVLDSAELDFSVSTQNILIE